MRILFFITTLLFIIPNMFGQKEYRLNSPDGKLEVKNVPFEKDIDSAAYLGAGFISDELKALKSLRKVAPAGYACAVKADRLLNE